MAVTNTMKTNDFPYIILHGVDNIADLGATGEKGIAAYFQILGVQPIDEAIGESVVKLGQVFIGNKAYWRGYSVQFVPFKVESNSYYNDYDDYLTLMSILKKSFIGIIDVTLKRGTNFWTSELNGEPIEVEVIDMPGGSPDFEAGSEELTITFKKRTR